MINTINEKSNLYHSYGQDGRIAMQSFVYKGSAIHFLKTSEWCKDFIRF